MRGTSSPTSGSRRGVRTSTPAALAGPIEVRGAKAGPTLVVRIEEVRPAHWGVTHGGENHAVYWDSARGSDAHFDRELDLKLFLGVMGMPPPEPGIHSTIPPRRWGGNLDCKARCRFDALPPDSG